MNTIELRGVTKTFGKTTAVDDLSLDVPQGAVYGFIGPNGSGKTTTLRMIMNIFYPDRGTIRVFGDELRGTTTDRIGYLPEERGLYKNMKVYDLLKFYGELKNGPAVSKQIDYWSRKLNMEEWGSRKIKELSKGMSQKVQFLSTIISEPELIILDEPFSGLDPVNANAIKNAVLELQQRGTTVIFSTHDMSVAEKMCDYILMIFQGRKVLDGTLESIQGKYGSDTIRVRTEGGGQAVQDLDGVDRVNDSGHVQELRMKPDADPQSVLQILMTRTRVSSFEVAKPSLEDIFIRIAGPEAREVQNA